MNNEAIRIYLPSALRDFAGGSSEVSVAATSVREAMARLGECNEHLLNRILSRNGELRPYVNIFVDQQDIRALDGLDTSLAGRRELVVVPSVAGG